MDGQEALTNFAIRERSPVTKKKKPARRVVDGVDTFCSLLGFQSLEESVWALVDALCYSQHGGSGYGFTRTEVLDMETDEAQWFLERLGSNRQREAQAMRGK